MSQTNIQPGCMRSSVLGRFLAGLLFAALIMLTSPGHAQQLTATLSGNVYDQTGAVIPNAGVTLKNQASGDERAIVSDASGHFVITALQPATYSISVAATGFSSWQENDIVLNQGDNRDVTGIKLQIGGNSTKVDVVSGADVVVPLDTAEVSTSLNTTMIDEFPLEGRDAGELLKIMPGMALNNGSKAGSGFNPLQVGSNNGPVGAYSSNGTQPNGAMAYMLDGANLVDPGNAGTQIANINQDMTASIKVLTSSYGAEYAKGPTIFQAFSKSGGAQFHGEAYLYTHNATLDSVDAFTKAQGGTNAAQSYYYAGGNIGGPILLPFTRFNRKRNTLFFWTGYEYMKQQPAGSIINYNVPNAAQLGGDFSNTGIPAGALTTWTQFYDAPSTNLAASPGANATTVPTADFDPNILGILKLYPHTNETPSPGNGYSNYNYVNTSPQNRYEATGKVDYSLGDNTKITGSYTYQHENDLAPIAIWWQPPNELPYPTPAASATVSQLIMINGTHVFNATTTNEFVFTRAHFQNPYTLSNPGAVSRATTGFNVGGLFGDTSKQIPNFETYCCSGQIGNIAQYDLDPGSFGGIKSAPAIYDNFTKVIGDHALKVGMYWDTQDNTQGSTNPGNGTFTFAQGSTYSTNNIVADLFLGRVAQYTQQNTVPVSELKWHQWSVYGQDQWKAAKTLTLNIGLRADHIGQWYGQKQGLQVFDGTAYSNATNAPANTGLEWNAIDSSTPVSGWNSPLFYYSPRIGLAYDVFGTGKTVFRGGIAMFRYQDSYNQADAAAQGPLGSFSYSTPNGFEGYANLTNGQFTPPSSVAENGSSIYAMQKGDNRVPFTTDWNATVSQALPWRSVLEVSYVANRSANEYLDGGNSNLFNLNNVAPGGFFQPDPLASASTYGTQQSPSRPSCNYGAVTAQQALNEPIACTQYNYAQNFNTNDYRPLVNYQNLYLQTHAGYSHYDSLQASFQKQSGPVTFVTNYTFSKVLGTRDGVSSNGNGNGTAIDPFNINNNYGPLAYDHTHILNLTYSWNLPKPIHNERILEGAINGWQLSGYTTYQSGAPIQPNEGGTLNATYPGGLTMPTIGHPNLPDESITLPNGLKANSVNPSVWFGSNAFNALAPALTCDPRSGLKNGMRFNPACYTTPAYGQQGTIIEPYIRNPGYFDTDLGIFKNFRVTENQKIQIRASAINFINHAQPQFGLANNSDITLNFQGTANATCAGCSTIGSNGLATPIQLTTLSPTNTNTVTTGRPAFETGSRIVTLAAKYYF